VTSCSTSTFRNGEKQKKERYIMMKMFMVLCTAIFLSGCGDLFEKCPGEKECGNGCAPTSASCCPDGDHYCDAPYTCGSDNMCHGSGGGGGGGGCGCGTQCNSNGICCPRGWYGCKNMCYSSYNAMLSAGCSSVKTCCP
jgi:hypothetical protein